MAGGNHLGKQRAEKLILVTGMRCLVEFSGTRKSLALRFYFDCFILIVAVTKKGACYYFPCLLGLLESGYLFLFGTP